jgi:hypothetical protein
LSSGGLAPAAAGTPLYGAKSRKKLLRPTQPLHNGGGRSYSAKVDEAGRPE